MDYSVVFYIIIAILAAAVDVFLIPWIKTKVDSEKLNKFLTYVRIMVQAAEQMFGSGEGTLKKQYVRNALESLGFKYSEELINNAIESIVLELK